MPHQKHKQRLMTLDEFSDWIATAQPGAFVEGRTAFQACRCGDVNCHGWKLVRITVAAAVSGE